jgi:hypothetical protein
MKHYKEVSSIATADKHYKEVSSIATADKMVAAFDAARRPHP